MSLPQIVHPVPVEDAEQWLASIFTTFLKDPYGPELQRRLARYTSSWCPERTWAAREGGRIVATLATDPFHLTVPGAGEGTTELSMDGVTAVTVSATHRRRGLLTAMIAESLRAAKERGDPLSGLVAAEWPIYGRFGFGPATQYAEYVYRTRGRGATITPSPDGEVRQVEPEELVRLAPAVFERARGRRAGQIDRSAQWWQFTAGAGVEPIREWHHWFVHEGPDGPSGLLGWRPGRDWDIDNSFASIKVTSLVAADDVARRNLWAYLGGMDVVGQVEFDNLPVDEPARWLPVDGRAVRQSACGDFLWLRLLDVPAALSARGYATAGRVVLDVVDDAAQPYAAGRFVLDASDAGVDCRTTRESPDLTLPARALASVYLGGYRLAALAGAGAVDEHRPGALARFGAMLTTPLAPWCQTGF